jgi:hypothetical protein
MRGIGTTYNERRQNRDPPKFIFIDQQFIFVKTWPAKSRYAVAAGMDGSSVVLIGFLRVSGLNTIRARICKTFKVAEESIPSWRNRFIGIDSWAS